MIDWVSISSLATAGGTLVLAVATFASVRSGNRTARAAERSLLSGLRPLLVPSRLADADEKVHFQDEKWVHIPGGGGVAEVSDDAVYEGGQRMVSRFVLAVRRDERWIASASRHWNVDRADPR